MISTQFVELCDFCSVFWNMIIAQCLEWCDNGQFLELYDSCSISRIV